MSARNPAAVLAMKAVTTFYRRLFFVVRAFDRPIPKLHSQLPIEMRLLSEKDLHAYLVLRPDQKPEQIRDRLRLGHQCHVSWHQGEIVDAAWCATGLGPVPYLGRQLVLAPNEVFIFDAYTAPKHRGHNLFMAKFTRIFRLTRDAGYARNSGVVAVENRTSMTVLRRLGCEAIGLYSSVGIGRCRWIWQQPFTEEPLPLLCAARSVHFMRWRSPT
ncbi:MAG: hypothetical protein N3B01_09870 [Verrucomicrobiae bacterium]|nr:hypothetical protein [Verrucomicrobiae bacterium]